MRALRLLLICGALLILVGCDEPNLHSKAEAGDSASQYSLGEMFATGINAPLDYAEAAKWYRKAASQGHIKAQSALGAMYALGMGVTKDEKEAVIWCRKAAEQGDADAQYNLGDLYARGEFIPNDIVEAYAWFNLASISYNEAKERRGILEQRLTSEQIVRAQRRSSELYKEIEARKRHAGK